MFAFPCTALVCDACAAQVVPRRISDGPVGEVEMRREDLQKRIRDRLSVPPRKLRAGGAA